MRVDAVPPAALRRALDTPAAPVILDVRTRREFGRGRIPGAVHQPFWRLAPGAGGATLPRDRQLVVYCGHGPRAWIAAVLLRLRGFTRVATLAGHMAEWRRRGLPEDRG